MIKNKNTFEEVKPSNILKNISKFSFGRKVLIVAVVATYYYFRYYNV